MNGSPFDVFVSYAHVDNEIPLGASKGWVTTLADELEKVLRRLLGRPPSVFMDHKLAGNEAVTPALHTHLRNSRVLLLVMSPGYQRSRWCQRELTTFLEEEALEKNESVFVVEIDPMERSGWHPALRELIPVRFWERQFESIAPRLLGYPLPRPAEDSQYWDNLNRLAHLIRRRLTRAEGSERSTAPVVWVAETTEDLLEERESVVATLRQLGYDVRPAAPYPRESRDPYLERLQDDLGRAVLLLQLLGPREGYRPTWNDTSFVALQAATAARTARERGVELCQWRSRDIDAAAVTRANANYGQLLVGAAVMASRLEEFKREVRQRLQRLQAGLSGLHSPPVPPKLDAGATHGLYVYVNADSVDRELAARIQHSLRKLGVTSAVTPMRSPGETPRQIRLAQQEQLEVADAVVLVYGRAKPAWVQTQLAFAHRARAERHRLRTALVDGPPPDKPDAGLQGPDIYAVNCRSGFSPEMLSAFVQEIRAASAHG